MKPLVPLSTRQGITLQELTGRINHRRLAIWGCGFLGRSLKRCLDRNGLAVAAYCDANLTLQETLLDGVPVLAPDKALHAAKDKNLFLLIASSFHSPTIEQHCLDAGLGKGVDFLGHRSLFRPEAAVSISAPSCAAATRSDKASKPGAYMSATVYAHVLEKLVREIPELLCVDLSAWGEPLLNPDVAEIIRLTEQRVPCKLATHLRSVERLEQVIQAQPSQLLITVNGVGNAYEALNEGCSWPQFLENLRTLEALISRHQPQTILTLLCHRYKGAPATEQAAFAALCSELGFTSVFDWPYFSSYDALLSVCEGASWDAYDQQILARLPWHLEKALACAKGDAHKPCLCQRIFPVIHWDCSVGLCHLYTAPIVARDWMTLTLDDIINLRHAHEHCGRCQSFGLHRLDIDVLLKHPGQHDILF